MLMWAEPELAEPIQKSAGTAQAAAERASAPVARPHLHLLG